MPAITRDQAATALHARLKSLSAEVKQSAIDASANGYGPDLDEALRRMELDDVSALDSYAKIGAFLVISRYFSLSRISALLATRVDTEAFAVEGDRETIFDNVMELKAAAIKEAAVYGYILETNKESQIGSGNQPVDQDGVTTSWGRDVWDTSHVSDPYLPYVPPYGVYP